MVNSTELKNELGALYCVLCTLYLSGFQTRSTKLEVLSSNYQAQSTKFKAYQTPASYYCCANRYLLQLRAHHSTIPQTLLC